MANCVVLRHPTTIMVTDFNNPNNLTNDLLIINPLIINKLSRGEIGVEISYPSANGANLGSFFA